MSVYAASVGELSRRDPTHGRRPSGLSVQIGSVNSEPISVSEAQDFARIDTLRQAAILQNTISAVREGVEKYTRRLLVRRQVTLKWEDFYGQTELLYPPFDDSSVTVKTKDDGSFDKVDSKDVTIDGWELSLDGSVHATAVKIIYQAGFQSLPPSLKLQMLRDIRTSFDHRDTQMTSGSDDPLFTASAYDQWRLKR